MHDVERAVEARECVQEAPAGTLELLETRRARNRVQHVRGFERGDFARAGKQSVEDLGVVRVTRAGVLVRVTERAEARVAVGLGWTQRASDDGIHEVVRARHAQLVRVRWGASLAAGRALLLELGVERSRPRALRAGEDHQAASGSRTRGATGRDRGGDAD